MPKVHYNLQRCRVGSKPKPGEACWSVHDGAQVAGYASKFALHDVKFVVQPGGLQSVRKKGQRAVIAYVKGEVGCPLRGGSWAELRFNPFRDDTFRADGHPVKAARCVRFEGRKAYVLKEKKDANRRHRR
jgi:hypothetical protein